MKTPLTVLLEVKCVELIDSTLVGKDKLGKSRSEAISKIIDLFISSEQNKITNQKKAGKK